MDWSEQITEVRDIAVGTRISVESGFAELRKDVGYLVKFYVPLAVGVFVALIIAICALVIALENRALILSTHTPQILGK